MKIRTTADNLTDATLRHKILLTRFEMGLSKQVSDLWHARLKEILVFVKGAYPDVEKINVTPEILWPLEASVGQSLSEGLIAVKTLLAGQFSGLIEFEKEVLPHILYNNLPDALKNAVQVFEAENPVIPDWSSSNEDVLLGRPINGKTWEDRLTDLEEDSKMALSVELRKAARGRTKVDVVAAGIERTVKMTLVRSVMTARTELHNFSVGLQEQLYERNQYLLRGVEYLATLDERTCLVCGSYDRNKYFFKGSPSYASRPFIPVHPRCRCVYSPVTRTSSEFGIHLSAGDRASLDGPVSGSLNFESWLKRQPVLIMDDVLGKNRLSYFRRGMTLDQMVVGGKPLNLSTLKRTATRLF